MGVYKPIKERTTKEIGLAIVDENSNTWARFPLDEKSGASFTSEIEIVRGELALTLYENAKEMADWRFGERIASIEDGPQEGGTARVTFEKSGTTEEFDYVILSEGLHSRTRAMVWKEDVWKPIVPFDMWCGSWSIPRLEGDTNWAELCRFAGGRSFIVRPDGFGRMRLTFTFRTDIKNTGGKEQADAVRRFASSKVPMQQQKEYIRSLLLDVKHKWIVPRLLEGLETCDDVYLQEIGQVRTPAWNKGRVGLVGDTAFCPSPFTGMGTSSAIIGAYTLSCAIATHGRDHTKVYAEYESKLREWIEKVQNVPKFILRLFNPETTWGIYFVQWVFVIGAFLVKTGIFNLFGQTAAGQKNTIELLPFDNFPTKG